MVKESSIHAHFRKADPILFSLLPSRIVPLRPSNPGTYFNSMCRTIIGQQLSTTAADTIYTRFRKLFGTRRITPTAVLAIADETLRGVGMSYAKIRFVKDWARRVYAKEVPLSGLSAMENEAVIDVLTQTKGIGKWTAEMFLMFTLGREDVFSFGDLGLKRAIQTAYKKKSEPSLQYMERLSKRWMPYRTYAALALWAFKDQ
jgi:DNA-3-methyladenine glycosylase II